MALTPLEVEVLNVDGSPAVNATIEVRHELTGVTASPSGYERDGSPMADPILTDSTGAAVTWLPNGIYEWRSVGAVTSGWRAFRAYAGFGVEGIVPATSSMPISMDDPLPAFESFTVLDTVTVPSFGVEDGVGRVEVTLDFAFSNMADLVLRFGGPDFGGIVWDGSTISGPDYAFDGTVTFTGSELGEDPLVAPIVDGGLYTTGVLLSAEGTAAAGAWVLQWYEVLAPGATGRTGELRDWSIEFLPD